MTTIASPALHPSERRARALPPIAWHALALLGAALVVVLAGVAVRVALAGLVAAPTGTPPLPSARSTSAAIGADPAHPEAPLPADPLPTVASPAKGTTGTAELPPVPLAAQMPASADATITSAASFSLAAASRIDRARALECLTAAIYYEAASEPDDGQRAVAQVVLNRVRHPAFPATVCGVVYQGSERSGCQFSFACDGAMTRVPSRSGWARAARHAAMALNGYVFAPVGLATHYHTYAVTPAWNRTLVMTDAVGAHFFHRWKGYWGTAAAFTQHYVGGEPLPGPHQSLASAPAAASADAPAAATDAAPGATPPAAAAVRAVTPATQVQPQYRASGDAVNRSDQNDSLPDSQVLDRWRDSGRPLAPATGSAAADLVPVDRLAQRRAARTADQRAE